MNTGVVINVGNDVLSASVASPMMILGHNYLHDRGIAKMEDIKKVIKGVHDARRYLEDREWVDKSVGVHIDALNDALALLKEQDAVKPKCKERMGGFVAGLYPTCGTALNNVLNVKACGKCGQAVKWDDEYSKT